MADGAPSFNESANTPSMTNGGEAGADIEMRDDPPTEVCDPLDFVLSIFCLS